MARRGGTTAMAGGGAAKERPRSTYRLHCILGARYRESGFRGTYGEWLKWIGYGPGRPRGTGQKNKG